MDYARLANVLPQFIGRELLPGGGERPLTVTDFRLGIRHQNLTELRSWSSYDLDLMEAHAAQFDADAPLDKVLDLSANEDATAPSLELALVDSPSPFAWT